VTRSPAPIARRVRAAAGVCALAGLALALAGCGNKGPLRMPGTPPVAGPSTRGEAPPPADATGSPSTPGPARPDDPTRR
jgi:predicted small lipoprotein YifL